MIVGGANDPSPACVVASISKPDPRADRHVVRFPPDRELQPRRTGFKLWRSHASCHALLTLKSVPEVSRQRAWAPLDALVYGSAILSQRQSLSWTVIDADGHRKTFASPSEGKGHTFESCRVRQSNFSRLRCPALTLSLRALSGPFWSSFPSRWAAFKKSASALISRAHPTRAIGSMKIPDSAHPITIEPAGHRIRITHGGQVIADSRRALALKEAAYPVVHYIPRADVDMSALAAHDHATHCPYKGRRSLLFDRRPTASVSANAIWTYEAPFEAVREIAGPPGLLSRAGGCDRAHAGRRASLSTAINRANQRCRHAPRNFWMQSWLRPPIVPRGGLGRILLPQAATAMAPTFATRSPCTDRSAGDCARRCRSCIRAGAIRRALHAVHGRARDRETDLAHPARRLRLHHVRPAAASAASSAYWSEAKAPSRPRAGSRTDIRNLSASSPPSSARTRRSMSQIAFDGSRVRDLKVEEPPLEATAFRSRHRTSPASSIRCRPFSFQVRFQVQPTHSRARPASVRFQCSTGAAATISRFHSNAST